MTAIDVRLKKLNIIIIKTKTKTKTQRWHSNTFFKDVFYKLGNIEETSFTYSVSKKEFETF